MSERVLGHECEVRLTGGPKDGWVYRYPMHWEVEAGVIVWRPPDAITTPIGAYTPVDPRSSERPFVYAWKAAADA